MFGLLTKVQERLSPSDRQELGQQQDEQQKYRKSWEGREPTSGLSTTGCLEVPGQV